MEKKLESQESSIKHLFTEGARQVTVLQAVEAFLRTEKVNWSVDTLLWYRRRLVDMAEALGSERPLSDLMEADLAEWYTALSERDMKYEGVSSRPAEAGGLSAYTLHGHIRTCKRFFRWLYQKGVLSVDLAREIKRPRLPKQQRKGITDAHALAIIDAARGNTRDYALIRFLESTGVRRGGIENLRLGDLNLESPVPRLRRRATVREKGKKERTVIMSDEALRAMVAWVEERPEVPMDDHVFVGHSPGQPWHGLKDVGISEIIDRYKAQLGLKGPCSPHQWRHRWCRNNLERGMPIGHVSQLAGHADIKVTHDYYGGFSIDQLQTSFEQHYRDPEGKESE